MVKRGICGVSRMSGVLPDIRKDEELSSVLRTGISLPYRLIGYRLI